jgi:hypothetical protein
VRALLSGAFERRGVITLVTAPGDGEVSVVGDDTLHPPSQTARAVVPLHPVG